MKLWRYVIARDTGTAPNFEPPAPTLALCKPRIRDKARVGDVVVAFCGAEMSEHREAVRWAGVVTEVLSFADFWSDRRFTGKKPGEAKMADNIYEPDPSTPSGFRQHQGGCHGPQHAAKDISGRNVLVFGGPNVWNCEKPFPILPLEFGHSMGRGRIGHREGDIEPKHWQRLRKWLDGASPRWPSQDTSVLPPAMTRTRAALPGRGC